MKINKAIKKITGLLCVVCMVLGYAPQGVFAADSAAEDFAALLCESQYWFK